MPRHGTHCLYCSEAWDVGDYLLGYTLGQPGITSGPGSGTNVIDGAGSTTEPATLAGLFALGAGVLAM